MTASSALPSGAEFVPRGDLPRRIHQIIDPWASGQPNAPALLQGETVMSFGQLDAAVTEASRRLADQGLRAGDRLLLLAENSIPVIVLALACSRLDAWLVPGGCVPAFVLLLSGRLADRFPPNRVAMAGLAFFAVSAVLMGFSSRATGFWMLALWVAIGRVGLGLIIPGLNSGALRLLPHGTEAAGSASINFFRQFGGALGVTLLALFLEGRERHLDALHGLQPMQEGFFPTAFVYCLALILAWMMTGRTQGPQSA